MIPDEIRPALMEFSLRCREIPGLKTAVLFGSAAIGPMSKKSDIDIFLLFDSEGNPETGAEANLVHGMSGEISSRFGLPYPFSFVMNGREEPVEPSFLRELLKDGIVLFARTRDALAPAKEPFLPFVLVSYTLKGMRPKEKMALQRALYGYETVRIMGGKRYRNARPGLVGESGKRVGATAFLIPYEKAEETRAIFKRCKCQDKETPVWLEEGGRPPAPR
jgi:predicted nucleotidyltransferase